jgi:hypothetical protein
MAAKKRIYVPSMSDATVQARTGKDWKGWFGVLDEAGAGELDHRAIAKLLAETHRISGWWTQMVTVEYERARGLRARHETPSGFAVAVSKTLAASLPSLYAAAANAAKREQWFPKGAFAQSSHTKNKYVRGSWNESARLEIGFLAKGAGKAQIALQVSKLAKKADVERERAAWKTALGRLALLVE